MDLSKNYPRLLIIYNQRINKEDQHGVSIRGWFGDWPQENLAQIYSGGELGQETFCKYNYKLTSKDRRFGKYFFKLKESSIGQSSYPIRPGKEFTTLKRLDYWTLIKNKFSKFLIRTGLWELLFLPRLSKDMIEFVQKFNPEIIYCQGYSLIFAWLPVMIRKKFDIPICFQTGDDWPANLYKNTPVSFALRPIVKKAAKVLILNSAVRLANSKLMADDYKKRYNCAFEILMMCDNLERFQKSIPSRVVPNHDTISIIYSGGLANGRWVSIVDLCNASKELQKEGIQIMVTAFVTLIPRKAVNFLQKLDNLQILPGPSHEDLPSYLKGADILFLPESFEDAEANAIRLSVSTKAHLYMMSEKPILVYASPATGIMDYAREYNWACIVSEKKLDKLTQAIQLILSNPEYSKELVTRGIKVALKNHDEHKVKERLLALLNECK